MAALFSHRFVFWAPVRARGRRGRRVGGPKRPHRLPHPPRTPRRPRGGAIQTLTLPLVPTKSPQTCPGTLHLANFAMKWRSAPGPGPPGSPAQCMPPAPRRTCGAAAPPGWFMGPCGRRRPRRVLLLPGRAAGARTMPPPLPPLPPLPPPPAPLRPGGRGRWGRAGGGAQSSPPPPARTGRRRRCRRRAAPRGAAVAPRRPARPRAGRAARPASSGPRPPHRRPPRRTQSRPAPGHAAAAGPPAPGPRRTRPPNFPAPRPALHAPPGPAPQRPSALPPLLQPLRKVIFTLGKKFGEPPVSGTQGVNGNSSTPTTHPQKVRLIF